MKKFAFRGTGRKAGLLAVAGLMMVPVLAARPQAAQADTDYVRVAPMHRDYNYEFTGRVVDITGDSSFNLRMGRRSVYNVYTERPMTHRLSKGDRVEVAGVRVGRNDIRHAHVRILVRR